MSESWFHRAPQPGPIRGIRTGQRGGGMTLTLAGAGLVAVALIGQPGRVIDSPPTAGDRYERLVDRIDPNTADRATLSALPQIGSRRAGDIIAYRESSARVPAFTRPADLLKVRGIGPAILEQLEPMLAFPAQPPPAGQPSPAAAGAGRAR